MGNNKLSCNMEEVIPVAEIFGPTIQGEGPNTGVKTLFVRVAGCSFKCEWCDSKFAWDTSKAEKYSPSKLAKELIKRCYETNTSHVVLTGGNPCLYNFTQVIEELVYSDIDVDVETQGDLYPEWLSLCDLIVISPKAPSSGQKDIYDRLVPFLLDGEYLEVAIKIPVFNDEDFEFAKKFYELSIRFPDVKLYLSVGNTDTYEEGDISSRVLSDYRKLIDKVMSSNLAKVYVMPQVHTLVWGNKQGV